MTESTIFRGLREYIRTRLVVRPVGDLAAPPPHLALSDHLLRDIGLRPDPAQRLRRISLPY